MTPAAAATATAARLFASKVSRQVEIAQHRPGRNAIVFKEQDVVGLDVAVKDARGVHVLQAKQQLARVELDALERQVVGG